MTFEENPFRVLNVSIYDTKATIVERADDLAFAQPDDEKIIAQARDILLNPRKRIAAEVRRFDEIDLENLFPLAGLNKLIYSIDGLNREDKFEAVIEMHDLYSELDAEEIRTKINAARKKSKFPAVQDTDAINAELKNLRYEIREKVQNMLSGMSHGERIKFANELADYYDFADEGVVIEDFFDRYELETAAFLNETTEKISGLLTKIKSDVSGKFLGELTGEVTAFVNARRPVDKFSIIIDRNSFDDSEEIFYSVRQTAINLYNDKHLIDYPLKIIKLLERNFSYLPKLAEMIRKDVAFLEKAQANQPSRAFLDAKAALDAIKRSIERGVRFDKYAEQQNLKFYHTQFKAQHESILREFMNRQGYKPDEWQLLNFMAASIYIQVGAAMTWTPYPDLAYECFEKALPCAQASGDAKLISLARQRIDEWRPIAKPSFSEQCKRILKKIIVGILDTPVIGPYAFFLAIVFAISCIADFVSWILSFFR